MVAKCSYAFSFAADAPCTHTVGSSDNLLEMVSVDGDNGQTSVSNSCPSGSNSCPLSNSCQYTDSFSSSMTHGGCLLANNTWLSASGGCSLATCSCPVSSGCMQTAECVARQCTAKVKDETIAEDKDEAAITIKDDTQKLSDTLEATEITQSCGGTVPTAQGLVPMKIVDIKTETDLLLQTEGENKCGRFSATLSESMDQLGLTTNADDANRPSEDSMDKEGSSCSLWGDPPVLDNSVMWDSVPTQKEDLDSEASSKISDSGAPNSDEKTAVLWDKPPSLTKMEEENDVGQNETNKRVERTGSRRWSGVSCIGAGLQNLGNTCFVNATLQCLTYTPPLVNYLLAENNSTSCRVNGLCLMCELGRHMTQCFQNSGNAIKPHSILQKLKVIAKHMRWGRQEDAHEFLRYMVDAMNKSCINGHQVSLDNSKETIVNKIFGGYLRSQVTCLQCKAESNTYDPFLDLSLDVKNVSSIIIALQKFVQPETLDIDNAYNCTKCQQKVCAQKRFTIHRLSNILTIQLKRYGVMGGKVTRHIGFPDKLDLRPYMSKLDAGCLVYQLYGVLVHDGHSTNSGHYYCYIMTAVGEWYCMNDHMVRRSSLSQVMNAEAYLLLYIRQSSSSSGSADNLSLSNSSSDGNSPIHRGAVINDSQHLESILKDDHHVPQKERVTCRGGQLPASCKGGQLGTKIKSILTGSKLQYSKTIQHKVKRLSKAQNFVMAKSENKSAKMSSKKPAKAVVRKRPLRVRKKETVAGDGPSVENVSGTDAGETAKVNPEDKIICEISKTTEKQQVAGDTSKSTEKPQVVADKSKAAERHQAVSDKLKANKKNQVLGDKLKLTEKHQIFSERLKANEQNQVISERLQLTDKLQAVGDKIKTAEGLQVAGNKLKAKDKPQVICNKIKATDKTQVVSDHTKSIEKHQAISVRVKAGDKSSVVSDKTKAREKLQVINDKVKTADKAKSTEKHQANCELPTGISVERIRITNDRSKTSDKVVSEKAVITDEHLATSNFSKKDEGIRVLNNVSKKLDRNLDTEIVKVAEKNRVIADGEVANEKCPKAVSDLQTVDSIQVPDDRLKVTEGNRCTRDDLKIASKIPIASDQSKGIGGIKSTDESCDGVARVTEAPAENMDVSLPRIVLKIKQGKVVLKESPNINSTGESSCSRKLRIPESPTTFDGSESKPDILRAKKIQNPVVLQKMCDKLSAHKKQLVRKGSGHSGQVASGKQRRSVTGTTCKSPALGRLGNKAATRRQKNSSLKETPTVCKKNMDVSTPKSYDIYDFSAESDSENIIQKTPTRKSPKASLFKATFNDSLDAELNATTQVPGLNIPLNKRRRTFCPRSHQKETKERLRQKQPRSPVPSLTLDLNAATEDLRFKLSKNSSTVLLPASARKIRSESACITPEVYSSTSAGTQNLNPHRRTSVSSRRNIHSSLDSIVTKLISWQPAVDSCTDSVLPVNSTLYEKQSNNSVPSCTSESDSRDLNCSATQSRFEHAIMLNDDNKQPTIPIEHQSILATSESPDVKCYGSQDSSSALTMQQLSLDCIPARTESGNQSYSNSAVHNQSMANNANSPAIDSSFSKVSRKKVNGQDHRTREKRRKKLSTSETVVNSELNNANCGRLSLKRKAKFNGSYDHETLCRNKEQIGQTELGSKSSDSLPPCEDNLAVVPIKLKIRKVSKDEDGANIYQVISNCQQTTSSSGRRDSLSHQDAAGADGGTTHHASSAKGSPRISATDVKSSTCSPIADFGKPPTNNQVRESRNIFQNLEEAVMHTREEFTRQTGLDWPKLDQTGLLQMSADQKSLTLLSQQNLPILSGFDWTSLLNHTEPDQT